MGVSKLWWDSKQEREKEREEKDGDKRWLRTILAQEEQKEGIRNRNKAKKK